MPDIGLDALLNIFGTAGAEAAVQAGADALPAAGLESLTAAGLPFAAGAGELGSVATGLGPLGVSGFGDLGAIAAALGAGGTAGIPLAADLTAAGLPAAAGIGEVGAISNPASIADALLGAGASAGTGVDVTSALAGLPSPEPNVTPVGPVTTSPPATPVSTPATPATPAPTGTTVAGGIQSVGPTAGTPNSALPAGTFGTTNVAPGAPGAVAPVGAAGAGTDLTSTATGAAGSAASGAASKGGSWLDSLVKGAQVASPLVAGAGLGYSLLKGNAQPSGVAQNTNLAPQNLALGQKAVAQSDTQNAVGANLTQKGTDLTGYLPSGTLPPDMQASLDNATSAAKTKAISNAAANGLPTDPTKNTVLAQQLASIDQNALTTKAQMEQQLLQGGTSLIGAGNQATQTGTSLLKTGLDASGLTSKIYDQLAQLDTTQQKQIGDAIAAFAKSLGGVSGKSTDGLTLKLA